MKLFLFGFAVSLCIYTIDVKFGSANLNWCFLMIFMLKELHRVLIKHDWNVADATVLLSTQSSLKAMTSENKVRAKAAASLHKHKGEQFVSFS